MERGERERERGCSEQEASKEVCESRDKSIYKGEGKV